MHQPPAGPSKPQGMFTPPSQGQVPINGPATQPNFVPQGQFPNQALPPRSDMNGFGALPQQPPRPPVAGTFAPPTSNFPPFQGGQSPSAPNQMRPQLPPQGNGPVSALSATSGMKRPTAAPTFQPRFGPPPVNQSLQPQVPPSSSSFQPRPTFPQANAQPVRPSNPNGQVGPPPPPNLIFSQDATQKPPSQKSSRGASPIPGSAIDALEGQFSPEQASQGSPVPTVSSQTANTTLPTQPSSTLALSNNQQSSSPVRFGGPPQVSQPGFPPGPPRQSMLPPAPQAGPTSHRFQGPQPPTIPRIPSGPPQNSQGFFQPPPTHNAAYGSAPQMTSNIVGNQPGAPPPSTSFLPPNSGSGAGPLPPPPSSVSGPRPGMPPPTSGIPPPPTSGMRPPPTSGMPPPPTSGMPPPPTSGMPPPPTSGMPPPPTSGMPPPPTSGMPHPPTSFPGSMPPYSTGQRPLLPGQMPPLPGQMPPPPGQMPPPPGQMPPPPGQMPSMMPPAQPPQNQPGMYNTQPHIGQTFPPSQPFSQARPGAPGMGMYTNSVNSMTQGFNNMAVQDAQRSANLLNEKHLIPPEGLETPKPIFTHDHKKVNCNPDVFRCTLNAIPNNSALLNKARLPLGILIHPFRDLSQLPVIQSSVIVRCRSCRTYINPFVVFVDSRRWKCNLCFRVNELPDEFSFDPVSKTYGDPQRRPEIKSATIEFIAPSEYMLRPPQPAVYLFLLDVSFNAVETGYLTQFSQVLLEELDKLPGDARTSIGFICYDSALYYFNLAANLSQPQMLCVPDLEDPFLPCPDNLLVNLRESRELIGDLLEQLPSLFQNNLETRSALGAALQSAHKLMSPTGGRVTIMQTCLPTVGPGSLQSRDSGTGGKNVVNIGPATDFYKKLSLDCSAQQIAVDLFMLNGQFADIATLSCISKYSGGSIYSYPSFHTVRNPGLADKYDSDLRRYFTRKIGFESVMRIRCTRGLSIHTFHGNFFVRSTDLLSLPNINPDAGFGMQMSIEDNLNECTSVSFQAALLYTSSKGERRIRVHTLCIPVTNQLGEVFSNADQQAVIALLSKMAVDRSLNSSLSDARDALINASLDALMAYGQQIPASQRVGSLNAPYSLRLMPMFVLAMLKSIAFGLSGNTKLDSRVFAMQQMKVLPVASLIQTIYPHLYPLHRLSDENPIKKGKEEIPSAPVLQLSSANIDRTGLFLMDTVDAMYLLVGSSIGDQMCQDVFEQPNFMSIPEGMMDLPELENPTSERIRTFVNYLMDSRPNGVTFMVLRDDSRCRHLFFQHMVEDRMESSMSYHEFLQFLQDKAKG